MEEEINDGTVEELAHDQDNEEIDYSDEAAEKDSADESDSRGASVEKTNDKTVEELTPDNSSEGILNLKDAAEERNNLNRVQPRRSSVGTAIQGVDLSVFKARREKLDNEFAVTGIGIGDKSTHHATSGHKGTTTHPRKVGLPGMQTEEGKNELLEILARRKQQ